MPKANYYLFSTARNHLKNIQKDVFLSYIKFNAWVKFEFLKQI